MRSMICQGEQNRYRYRFKRGWREECYSNMF